MQCPQALRQERLWGPDLCPALEQGPGLALRLGHGSGPPFELEQVLSQRQLAQLGEQSNWKVGGPLLQAFLKDFSISFFHNSALDFREWHS